MKGRRRARRVALQALYELDETSHALDVVLTERLVELFHSAAAGAVAPADLPLVDALARACPLGDVDETAIDTLAARLSVTPTRLAGVAAVVRRWSAHACYCDDLVRGVWSARETLDAVVGRIAPEWPVAQMSPIDRNVLRIALWEIANQTVPIRVAINEAVELARAFSGEGARRMVNGALGTYAATDHRLVAADVVR
jgi:transcription antitermination factor NusB